MARILLVEDVEVVRQVLRRMLERSGHEVTEAGDGQQALTHLAARGFDLMVTDIWMPGMDGIGLIGEAKRRNPGLRIVAVSGGAPRAPQAFSIQEARSAGADVALLKPVDRAELMRAVDGLLPKGK
ncbi:MAG: response regulator [Alphaproteobacteria bacterium]|nr:response regulator [Alphaproteobacteria bacterium]